MAKFMLDGQEYCGSGGSQIVELTQDEYDALPDTKKTDNILYAITDCDELSAENMSCKDASGNLSNVQDELDKNGIPSNYTLLLSADITSANNDAWIDFPNATSYKGVIVVLSGDAYNGQTFYYPRATFGISQPFSVACNASELFPTNSNYSFAVNGRCIGTRIYINKLIVNTWTKVTLSVYGLN